MKEIQHYDKAAHNFYQKQSFIGLPISGWDMFAQQFNNVCTNLSDATILKNISDEKNWAKEIPFDTELLQKNHVIVVTDSKLRIIHATKNIYKMNGYSPSEVRGQQPKMFQGKETCKETVKRISTAIKNQEGFEAVILNYRKDGSTYNCWIKGTPIHNKKGKLVNFIAFEREVA